MSTIHIQSVTPLIKKFIDDLLVRIPPVGGHSVVEIVQVGNWNATRSTAESPIKRSQLGSSWGCWGHTDGPMIFNKTFFFVCDWHSLNKTCRHYNEALCFVRVDATFGFC